MKGKILVVDDEKSVRDTFVAAFDEYTIVPIANAEEALEILKHPNDIDLAVVDVIMPGITGIELLREIKRLSPGLKVAIITGCDSKEVVIEALRADADEYIDKPFDIEKTKDIFERLVSQRRQIYKEEYGYPEGKIRQAQRLVMRNYTKSISLGGIAKEVCLSPKYLSHIFKEKTGKGFSEYKAELRISLAKELLANTKDSVSQIAYNVGYQNPESFMKMFKKHMRITPVQYRDNAGRKKNNSSNRIR